MKGVIFNAAEAAVVEMFDQDTWEDLLDAAELDGIYSSVETYEDADLAAIVAAASNATGMSTDEVLVAVGRKALAHLADRVPGLLEDCTCAFDMLRIIHDVIHVEVRKVYQDSNPPEFIYTKVSENQVRLAYKSPRMLDALAEGLVYGVGDRFGEELSIIRRPQARNGEVALDIISHGKAE